MKLPVHRWFRYSAGFSADWAKSIILRAPIAEAGLAFDPFAGSGTMLLASDALRVRSTGIEAHPFIRRVCQAKLYWGTSVDSFSERASRVLDLAHCEGNPQRVYPELIDRCYTAKALQQLDRLRSAWESLEDDSPSSELVWLAITTILRHTSSAGTAQWQYILPNKVKRSVVDPFDAFLKQIGQMKEDMTTMKDDHESTLAQIYLGDARKCENVADNSVSVVITSPPYANNYDYADATRLEMSFWGQVRSWGDLHEAVRKDLIVSTAQHASLDRVKLDEVLSRHTLLPIKSAIEAVCRTLAAERLLHGGKKHYHTMIASYFADIGDVWQELRRVCTKDATIHFVVGDSAPYGVYVPVQEWFGELAIASGFNHYTFVKLRDRNIKWKNRKHRVPLQEGILTVV